MKRDIGLAAVLTTVLITGVQVSWAIRPDRSPSPNPPNPFSRGIDFLGPENQPLPFQNLQEIENFLRAAKVVSRKRIKEGVNGIDKVLLEKDGIRLHGAFRDVSVEKHKIVLKGAPHFNFRDDCLFEVAAYRLSKLLGLENVPPVVVRRLDRQKGTLQLWVENAMTEKKRLKEGLRPPLGAVWNHQYQTMRLFDNLIYNDDRNLGNILIDSQWKLWMIDHTRAFRRHKQLKNPKLVQMCKRSVWESLKSLDPQNVEAELKDLLRTPEIRGVLARRDQLVAHLQKLIERKGEDCVLF